MRLGQVASSKIFIVCVGLSLATALSAACSSKSSGGGLGDDEGEGGSGSSGSGGTGSSGSGSSGTSTTGSTSGSPSCERVADDTVYYDDAGVLHLAGPGTTACDLRSHVACLDALTMVATCVAPSAQACSVTAAQFGCLEQSDCASGMLCCANNSSASGVGSACTTPGSDGLCPQATAGPVSGKLQFCQTSCECANKEACTPQSCTASGSPAAHLTLCGLQTGSSFTCTKL